MMSKTALDSCSMLHGGEGKYKKQEILLHFLFLKKVNIHLFQQWDVKKIFKASSTYPALSKVRVIKLRIYHIHEKHFFKKITKNIKICLQ